MAITYTGTNGLFTRLGKLFYVHELMESYQSNVRAEIEDVLDEFTNTDMYMLGNLPAQYKTFDAPLNASFRQLQNIARNILIETVNAGLSIESTNVQDALWHLIQDMIGSYYVEAVNYSTSGTVAAGGSNTGTGTLIVNSNLPKNIMSSATLYQTIKGEVLNFECVADESSDRQLGNEEFNVRGDEFVPPFDADWPLGSGVNRNIKVTCAKDLGAATQRHYVPGVNILRNSDFQLWESTGTPSNWTNTQIGSATYAGGTQPQQKNTTSAYIWNTESSGNLSIIGDSSGWQHRIYQNLNDPTGTRGRVVANGNYILSCRVRLAAGSGTVGGGALKFEIQNQAGTATSGTKTLDLTSVGTSWTHVTQPWDMSDTEIPTDARFAIDCTTAVPNGKTIVIDELVLAERVQLYPGGPGCILVRGNTDFRTNDTFTITYAHSASPPANKWQFYFDRFFSTGSMNYNLPTSGGSAIADSLIG